MKKNLLNIIKNLITKRLTKLFYGSETYSQHGEDLIIEAALGVLKLHGPYRYLDIGANHAYRLSNTALLYKKGSSGVLVEPNTDLVADLKLKRGKRDIILNAGISFSELKESVFYSMDWHVLSTFCMFEAKRYETLGRRIVRTSVVPLIDINLIFTNNGPFDVVSIDVEGYDFEILKTINFEKNRPTIMCIETLSYEINETPKKHNNIIDYMISKNYILFADTYLNSIFVDKNKYKL